MAQVCYVLILLAHFLVYILSIFCIAIFTTIQKIYLGYDAKNFSSEMASYYVHVVYRVPRPSSSYIIMQPKYGHST